MVQPKPRHGAGKSSLCYYSRSVVGTNVWDHLDRRTKVEAYIQPVQVTEEHRLVTVGMPQEIFQYEPQDGEWRDMLRAVGPVGTLE